MDRSKPSGTLEDFLAQAAAAQQPQPDQRSLGRDALAAILAKAQPQQDMQVRGHPATIGIRG